jgi:hypothetical protein
VPMRRRGLSAEQIDDAIHLYGLGWPGPCRPTPGCRPHHRAGQTPPTRHPYA